MYLYLLIYPYIGSVKDQTGSTGCSLKQAHDGGQSPSEPRGAVMQTGRSLRNRRRLIPEGLGGGEPSELTNQLRGGASAVGAWIRVGKAEHEEPVATRHGRQEIIIVGDP